MATDHAGIAAEAKRRSLADDGKTSLAERFRIRNEIRAEQGLGAEKHKRGGVAGAYDNSKSWAVPALTLAAGALTGGAALPALLGGLKGFDREGQSGIGFDLGQGLAGAASGYGLGKVGGALGGFAGIGGAAPAAIPAAGGAAGAAVPGAVTGAAGAVPAASGGLKGLAGKGLDFLTGDGGKNALGVITALDAAAQRRRQDDLTNAAVGRDLGRWEANAPLRDAGMAGLLGDHTPDMGNLAAIGARGNPFAMPASPANAPAMPPSAAPQGVPQAVPAVGPPPVAPKLPAAPRAVPAMTGPKRRAY